MIVRTHIPSRSLKQPKRTPNFKPFVPAMNDRMREHLEVKKHQVSIGDGIGNATKKQHDVYVDPLLQERENAARQVRHTIAPISNKGAYQLITNEADYKTMGRKV